MATYVDAYKGYIADVPEVWFKRCDGKIFHFDEVTQASVNPQTNFTEVNAGWSLYPVAYLPGQSTMEISMTSGQFNADLFAMANNRNFAQKEAGNEYTTFVTEHLTVDDTDHSVTLTKTPVADSVYVRGLNEGTTTTDFTVSGSKVTFADTTQTGEVEVSYETTIADAQVIEIDNKAAAIGEAIMKWPVYASGEDCTDSAIKGYVLMKVYRCRVTTMPGFDTSYKSAATNAVTWSAMDAKRDDGAVYNIAYYNV